jgi:hypothetical protein
MEQLAELKCEKRERVRVNVKPPSCPRNNLKLRVFTLILNRGSEPATPL